MGNNCCKNKNEGQISLNTEERFHIKSHSHNIEGIKLDDDSTVVGYTKNNSIYTLGYNALNNSHIYTNNFKNTFKEKEEREINKFIEEILTEFNKIRADPPSYSKKIESHMHYIFLKPDVSSYKVTSYYDNPPYPKINLRHGEGGFVNCIQSLKLHEPMDPLIYNKEIIIKTPVKVADMTDKNKIIELIKEKKKELSSYKCFGFHYDNGYINPEISAILQIVDDNNSNGQRRENILNPMYKYLGVSVGKIKPGRFIIFFSFAGEVII